MGLIAARFDNGTKVSASMSADTAELTLNSEFPDHIAV